MPSERFSRIAVIVVSGTPCRRAPPVCAPQTYIASYSRATTIAASTRTRMSSDPSKRTKAPRWPTRDATSGGMHVGDERTVNAAAAGDD